MNATSSAQVRPSLAYDFNMPPRDDGLYSVSLRGWSLWPILRGTEIIFGDEADGLKAVGRVVRVDGNRLVVAHERWIRS